MKESIRAAAVMAATVSACRGEPAGTQAGPAPGPAEGLQTAVFAGGCFWCMEPPFEKLDGVVSAVSGYAGGPETEPTYEQVSAGRTGHREAVQVTFDPARVSYRQLLRAFWMSIDPTDPGGQFADRGPHYTTAVFWRGPEQRAAAEASKRHLEESGIFDAPVATEILEAGPFWPAEDYHQDYCRTNPARYAQYRRGSGREGFLEEVWSRHRLPWALGFVRPPAEALRQQLTDLQYRVTREAGTERAFANPYWEHKAEGIYVDVVSGEPLFSSAEKYDSGSGWPSFTRPLEEGAVVERADDRLGMRRTEARSRYGDSHLGHVFDDGPPPAGRRYCINSAALRFVPAAELAAQGYGEYEGLFPAK